MRISVHGNLIRYDLNTDMLISGRATLETLTLNVADTLYRGLDKIQRQKGNDVVCGDI